VTIDGIEVLFYTLGFLVPGYVLYIVLAAFVPQRAEQTELSFLKFLLFSCINYAVWSWLIYLVAVNPIAFFSNHPLRTAVAWFAIIFLGPVLLGFLLGLNSQRRFTRNLLQKLGIALIHEIPTAWDYVFSSMARTGRGVWILVTLVDGSTVAGWFGGKSFASDVAGERDLFIETVYNTLDDGTWQPMGKSEGILIKGNEIRYIEFLSH
jgi:hypothetical protein